MIKLVTFQPICFKKKGLDAIQKFDFPPYIDGSCRREPDFENPFPSISALCRGNKFAPTLKKGDTAIYLSKKGTYNLGFKHWKLVAIVEVIERFETHAAAALWYSKQNLKLPNNCMVNNNPHLSLDETSGFWGVDVNEWNNYYLEKSKTHSVFLVCKSIYTELHNPLTITEKDMELIYGRRNPSTQNPPKLSKEQLNNFLMFIDKYGQI